MIPAQLKSKQEQNIRLNEIQTVETLTITQQTDNITVKGHKTNNTIVINAEGSGANLTQYWHAYMIGAIVGYKSSYYIATVFTDQNGKCGDMYIGANSNCIYLNFRGVQPDPTNAWIRGSLVFTL